MEVTENIKKEKIDESMKSPLAAEIFFLFIFPGWSLASIYKRTGKYGRATIDSLLIALLVTFVYILVSICTKSNNIQKDSQKERRDIRIKEAVSGGQISNFKNVENTSYEAQREYAKYKCNSGNGIKLFCLFWENFEVQVQHNNIISPKHIKHSSERNTCNDKKIEVPTGKEVVIKRQIFRAGYFPKHHIYRYKYSDIGNNHLNLDIQFFGLFGKLVQVHTNHVLV